jgi:hypothetical protein
MGFGKFLGCVVGGAIAVVAAPAIIAGAAVVGTAAAAGAATAGAAVAAGAATVGGVAAAGAATVTGVAATAGAAVASTTVGSAVVGAASTAGAAVASSTVGSAVAGAGAAVSSAAAGAGAAVSSAGAALGSSVATAATAASTAVSSSTVGSAVIHAGSTALGSEAVVAGVIGSSVTYAGITTVEGVSNMDEAKSIIKNVKSKYRRKRKQLEKWQQNVVNDLETLNIKKLEVYSDVIEKNIVIIKKITIAKEQELNYKDESSLDLLRNQGQLHELELGAAQAKQVLESVGKGTGLMYALSSSTLVAMSTVGIASTGTTIASLNGAAAYNATIAALGGGSLASGGGGMVLGHAVLGGITVIPAALITSYAFAKRSEEALTEAHEYRSEVTKDIEKMESGILLIERHVKPRINEIQDVVIMMGEFGMNHVYPALKKIEAKYENQNGHINFNECSEKDRSTIVNSVYYLQKLKEVLAVKIFNDQGELDSETKQLLMAIHHDPNLAEA